MGLQQVRVRHHGNLARIETDEDGFSILTDGTNRERVYDYFKQCGFAMSFKDVGDKLSGAQKSYDKAKERLTAGRGNISDWINKIREKSGIQSIQKIAIPFDNELVNQTENRSSVTI